MAFLFALLWTGSCITILLSWFRVRPDYEPWLAIRGYFLPPISHYTHPLLDTRSSFKRKTGEGPPYPFSYKGGSTKSPSSTVSATRIMARTISFWNYSENKWLLPFPARPLKNYALRLLNCRWVSLIRLITFSVRDAGNSVVLEKKESFYDHWVDSLGLSLSILLRCAGIMLLLVGRVLWSPDLSDRPAWTD